MTKLVKEIINGLKIIIKTIKCYWIDVNTNIFSNCGQAVAGFIPLLIIPTLSLTMTIHIESYTFWSYTFPLTSISISGIYDSYGRYIPNSPSKYKLLVRVALNLIVILLSMYCANSDGGILVYIAPIILILIGILLSVEMISKIYDTAITSVWFAD